MRSQEEVDEVLRLVATGLNDCEVARRTGIPRGTVRDWRRGKVPDHGRARRRQSACPRCDGRPLDEAAYAYLLGLYLGDGWISAGHRTPRLRIVQDARYPHLLTLTEEAIRRVRHEHRSIGRSRKIGCIEVWSYWKHWLCLFPQHGRGPKHRRRIRLTPWQRLIVDRYPKQLLRGLIHSDGCRVTNKVHAGRYAYTRYFFSNSSADVLAIFEAGCDRAGIPYRRSRVDTISLARSEGVAQLDSFIGPKA